MCVCSDIPKGLDDIGGNLGALLRPWLPGQRDTALGDISDLWLGGRPGQGRCIVGNRVWQLTGLWLRMDREHKFIFRKE